MGAEFLKSTKLLVCKCWLELGFLTKEVSYKTACAQCTDGKLSLITPRHVLVVGKDVELFTDDLELVVFIIVFIATFLSYKG